MNAHDRSMLRSDAAALPHSNPVPASLLDLPAARQFRDGLRTLLGAERSAAAEFLLALSDFDARRGWEPLGHASLFAFLRVELRLSSGAAFWRLSAARLVQRFPEVIEPLRDGRLCLSTTAELAKVLDEQNLADVLPRYFGLSAREAKEVTAGLQPRVSQPLRDVITSPVPEARVLMPSLADAPPTGLGAPAALTLESVRTSEAPIAFRSPERRAEVEPLSADLRRLHVTVSAGLLKMIDAARDGLSHSLPNATTEQVLEAALALLLEKQARARGQVKRPRAEPLQAPPAAGASADEPAPRHRRALDALAARQVFGTRCVDRYAGVAGARRA